MPAASFHLLQTMRSLFKKFSVIIDQRGRDQMDGQFVVKQRYWSGTYWPNTNSDVCLNIKVLTLIHVPYCFLLVGPWDCSKTFLVKILLSSGVEFTSGERVETWKAPLRPAVVYHMFLSELLRSALYSGHTGFTLFTPWLSCADVYRWSGWWPGAELLCCWTGVGQTERQLWPFANPQHRQAVYMQVNTRLSGGGTM